MKKIITGTILGGIVFFAWGAVSWMALPLHSNSIKSLPEEQLLVDTMKVVIKEPGFYAFPHDMSQGQEAWMEKAKAGPVGVVVFNPNGKKPMDPKQFIVSFLIGLFASFVSLLVLSFSRERVNTLGSRVLLLSTIGLLVWVISDLSYANWFSFPTDFIVASLVDNLVGFALLGLVLHKFVPTYE